MVKVGASLLAKQEEMEKESLAKKITKLEKAGIDMIHWDVMDGVYNPINTMAFQGPDVIKELRKITGLPFVAHLMIANPIEKIQAFHEAGCDIIVFHYEACKKDDVSKTIDEIRSYKRIPGIAIEPDTPVGVIYPYLDLLDYVLIMTVKTGYAGQKFIDETNKIRNLALKKGSFEIDVDGGINDITGKLCIGAGATALSAASYISGSDDYSVAIKKLRG
ncbi:MAG: ribulose-phosphate 3-epimerase [Candidatus Aenigmatarchaeota archaeon]